MTLWHWAFNRNLFLDVGAVKASGCAQERAACIDNCKLFDYEHVR